MSKGRPAIDSEEDISIEVKSVSAGNWQLKEAGAMPNWEIFVTISTIWQVANTGDLNRVVPCKW